MTGNNMKGLKMKCVAVIRKVALCSALIGACLSSYSFSNNQTPWQKSYGLEAAGDYAGAIKAVKPFLKGNSLKDSSMREIALIRAAWLEYLQGNHNASIKYYNKVLRTNPSSIDARLGVVLPLMAQSRWKEMKVVSKSILKSAPQNYQAHLYLLSIEQKFRQWAKLKKHAKQLLLVYPTSIDPWVFLARSENQLGNKKAAKEAYLGALAIFPTNVEALAFLENY